MSNCRDFIAFANDEWPNPLDYQVWDNAGVLSQTATETKISCWV